ncbi:hypothetical protein VTP01DRAFT_8002 [Rhizomucor pusillus]|uniref:uncharacterized protein n=1 Tax=Rhizomucor pusillus TaxID=4840 RepID=UPI0037437349
MIGPAIPQELLEKKRATRNEEEQGGEEEEEEEQKPTEEIPAADQPDATNDNDDDPDAYAPALPPDLLEARRQQKEEQRASASTASQAEDQPGRRRRRAPVGPTMPSAIPQPREEEEVIGPVLPSNYNPEKDALESRIAEIEERARQSREAMDAAKDESKTKKVERPEWMIKPPEIDYLRNADSSRSRGFIGTQMTEAEQDRSVWTDTPAERERKLKEAEKRKREEDAGLIRPSANISPQVDPKEMEVKRAVEYHNAVERPKSLMEIHREKRRKTKGESVEDVASRPFDREKDLLAPRKMDRKQRKELLEKSRELDSRFGSGSSSFL